MAGKPTYTYPPDDDLVEQIARAGSVVAWAHANGRNASTVDSYIRKAQLRERIRAALLSTPKADEERAVDDPQRVRADQDAATIRALKRENAAYADALATQEAFFDRIVEATKVPVKAPRYRAPKASERKPHRSAIAPIFDQQFGQFVRASDTPGNRGGYGVKEFDRRLARWVEGVTGILGQQAHSYQIDELVIPFGGDHVEGDEIFAGQPWQLELDPCRQVWELAAKMDSAVRELVRFAREELSVKHIACYGVDDNHGKVGGKRGGARPATYSWNWLFLKILFENHLRAEPIDEFAIEPGGALFFHCAGHQFQLIHGHQIRGWGGLPFYGLTKFDGRSMRLHNTLYRYLLMGHHHQPAEIPNGAGETIVSGDWVGANNLSGTMTAASRPQQRVIFVARKWGVTASEKVYFTEADEAYAPAHVYGRAA